MSEGYASTSHGREDVGGDNSGTWNLVGLGSVAQHQHKFLIGRQLDPSEAEAVLRAADLISEVSTGSKWNDVAASWTSLVGTISTGINVGDERELQRVNALMRDFVHTLGGFAKQSLELERWFADNPSGFVSLAQEWKQTGWSNVAEGLQTFENRKKEELIKLIDTPVGPGRVASAPALSEAAAGHLGLVSVPGRAYLVVPALSSILRLAERVRMSTLVALDDQIRDAARTLRLVAVDVPTGFPGVVRDAATYGVQAQSGSVTLTHRQLPVHELVQLSLSVLQARERLQQYRHQPGPSSGPGADHESVGEEGVVGTVDNGAQKAEESLPKETILDGHNREPADERPTTQISDAESDASRVYTPVDLVALIQQTEHVTADLERAWSLALSRVLSDSDIEAALSVWYSLLAAQNSLLEGETVKTTPNVFPVPPADLAAIPDPTTIDEVVKADFLAYLYVLSDFRSRVDSLRLPTRSAMDATGVRHWWESGAFAMLRDQVQLMLRLLQEIGLTTHSPEWTGEPIGLAPVLAPDRHSTELSAVTASIAHGLPEGAAIYLLRAIRTPGNLDNLSEVAKSEVCALTPKLEAIVTRLSEKDRVPLHVLLPVVFTLHSLLTQAVGPSITTSVT